jgi:biotin carboxyl carrier protein
MKKFLIKVNGNQYEVEVEEVSGQGSVQPAQISVPAAPVAPVAVAAPVVEKAAPVKPVAKTENVAPEGAEVVKSPMPGTILKVNVAEGEEVKCGQVILVLEAMKMENEITSPKDGIVASIGVSKGNSVNVGDVLFSIS